MNNMTIKNDEIEFYDLVNAVWKGKWIIIFVTFLFSVAAIIYSINLPNIYKSEALLAPVSEESGLKIPGQLGGLAALAGVNLGGLKGGNQTALAIEILKSREFIGRFIEENNLFLPIMAAEGWNRLDNTLIIDPEIYDIEKQMWVRETVAPFNAKPSVLETYEEFMKLLSISQDKATSMVKISVEHYSPYLAKIWVDSLVKSINDEMRNRELIEAQKSIDYLTNQVDGTNIADVRTMLFSLIEEQTKTVMLANVREEYIFKTVDPAVAAEKKAKPARALICVLAMILGIILATLIVLLRHFKRR